MTCRLSFALFFALFFALLSVAGVVHRVQADAPTAAGASSRGLVEDIADIDLLLAQVQPGQQSLFLGDMGLRVSNLKAYRQVLAERRDGRTSPNSSFDTAFKKWPGGNVPYTFSGVSSTNQSLILKACHDWEQVAHVHFYPRTSESNSVVFVNGTNGNNSYVGMIGGAQVINLQDFYEFVIAHEVGHALGMIHEQSRSDRDQYIIINSANIQSGFAFAFDIVPGSLNNGPYDFDSVMHYYLTAFSVNGQPTMTVRSPYDSQWNSSNVGTQTHLSALDKAGMAAIYGPPVGVSSTIRYVSPAGNDSNPGTLGQPKLTIQAAINASVSGDTVIIGDGTYTGPGNVDLTFGGRDMTVTSKNGPAQTIINCQGSSSVSHRGFVFQNGEVAAVLSGLTIENGYESNANGGGILISNCNVVVQNCIIKASTAVNGGGIYQENYGGTQEQVSLTKCTLTGNRASGDGGGLYNYNDGGAIMLTDCAVTSNTAKDGAGVYNDNSSGAVSLTRCILSSDSASDGYGGGIYNYCLSGLITLGDCSLTNDTATNDGGGVENNVQGGQVILNGCTISGSTAQSGGGIENYNGGGTVSVTNCAVVGNSAIGGYGGGVYNNASGGTTTLTNCTITKNTATVAGGGYSYDGGGTITLTNDIFYNDTGGELLGDSITVTHCDVQGGYSGTGNINAAPKFVSGTSPYDLHLNSGSPCLGAGTASGAPLADKDGKTRPNPPSIGAYELAASATNHTHLLWAHTSGQASVWTFSADGSHTVSPTFGPFPNWTAKALTAAPDGTQHLLWTNTSGAASLWNLAPNGSYTTSPTYGPYPGWSAVSLSTSPTTGQSRLLWTNTGGTASLWTIAPNGSYTLSPTFGPFPGWSAKLVAAGASTTDLVWTNTSGQASGWKFASDGSHVVSPTYGPYSNWSATGLSVGPDEGVHLLWDNVSGQIGLWSGDFGTGAFVEPSYGPFGGWSGRALATGSDNVTHVLWSSTSGQASVWSFAGSGSLGGYTHGEYGPFSGWSAVGLSAGP